MRAQREVVTRFPRATEEAREGDAGAVEAGGSSDARVEGEGEEDEGREGSRVPTLDFVGLWPI